MYIKIDGKKEDLGELKYIEYYFLKGYHADYQKGVLYANHKKNLAPLYNDEGDLTKIPEYAGKNKKDLDQAEVEKKVDSRKYSISAIPYMKKWNSELDKPHVGGLASEDDDKVPNAASERHIQSFDDFTNV